METTIARLQRECAERLNSEEYLETAERRRVLNEATATILYAIPILSCVSLTTCLILIIFIIHAIVKRSVPSRKYSVVLSRIAADLFSSVLICTTSLLASLNSSSYALLVLFLYLITFAFVHTTLSHLLILVLRQTRSPNLDLKTPGKSPKIVFSRLISFLYAICYTPLVAVLINRSLSICPYSSCQKPLLIFSIVAISLLLAVLFGSFIAVYIKLRRFAYQERMHNEPELTKKKASRLLLYGSHLLLHILISILLLVGDGFILQNANLYNQIQTMVSMNCDVVEFIDTVTRLQTMAGAAIFLFLLRIIFDCAILLVCEYSSIFPWANRGTQLEIFRNNQILLFVPSLSYSHVTFNLNIAEQLVMSGHNVTMFLSKMDNHLNYSLPLSRNIRLIEYRPESINWNGDLSPVLWENPGPYEDSSPTNPLILSKLARVSRIFRDACKSLVEDGHLIERLRREKFDLAMTEQYDNCAFGIFKLASIDRSLWLSATGIYRMQPEVLGVNYPLSYVSELFAPLSDEMTLLDRIHNLLVAAATGIMYAFTRRRESKIFHNGEHKINLLTLSRETSGVIVNSNPLFDFPAPSSHQFSFVGGFSIVKSEEQLSPYWQSVVDNSIDGFFLVTFGAIAKTFDMPIKTQQKFMNAFARFPNITFIVKYEQRPNILLRLPHNVVLTEWIPQKQLMGNSKYLAILTHGGWSSVLETILHRKPMVLMPLFADHMKNSQIVASKKVGIVLDKMRLTVSRISLAVRTIVVDKRYRKNCEKFAEMLEDSPVNHTKLLDWRVQVATRRKSDKFRLYPREATISPYYVKCIDLIMTVSLIVLMIWLL
ncbi:hypothetical protein WR25_24236 [Diploscapter pachys]|uniref:glucuronosyltransferase n=1 Tax=Diploscapter pachys TaxID=2018661 RepID=A0A2A2LKR3_9BILA|nr:hypothetical protein WR25_24236 [Diploscapter pachys]